MMEGIVWETPLNPPKREDYVFKDGKRLVKPYFFEFICNVKNRWAGKTVVDLFAHEFRQRPRDYYVTAVEAGRIQVDGTRVDVTYTVKSSQRISHFVHRHEPPVMEWNISVLKKEDDLVTVFKPPSIPVHPCGQYRKNTVLGILQAEHGLTPLFLHRLDRLVSGLLILARSAARADLFRQQIEGGKVRKEYVAKVIGVFPEAEQVVDAAIIFDAREGRSSVEAVTDDDTSSQKGKLACTKFNRISTNGVHSIVKCEPITGRTHQIRVHLQHLGHPIANDSLYFSEAYSHFLVKPLNDSPSIGSMEQPAKRSKSSLSGQISNHLSGYKELDVDEDFVIDPMCTNCPNFPPNGYDEHEEGLWLHCVRYSGPDWTYECPYPEWASIR
ncbi:RNA pseudouridine synthase 7 isoform X1 [Nymphaea colorata]|nr:RNA pseudouridine synthase 7 isoform X1 [Nymphaea colorata]